MLREFVSIAEKTQTSVDARVKGGKASPIELDETIVAPRGLKPKSRVNRLAFRRQNGDYQFSGALKRSISAAPQAASAMAGPLHSLEVSKSLARQQSRTRALVGRSRPARRATRCRGR